MCSFHFRDINGTEHTCASKASVCPICGQCQRPLSPDVHNPTPSKCEGCQNRSLCDSGKRAKANFRAGLLICDSNGKHGHCPGHA